MEEWRCVKDFPHYLVSSLGRVKSLPRDSKGVAKYRIAEKILKTIINNHGYKWVNLYNGTKRKSCYVHRLVAEAFIPNPENKPNIDHINTDTIDNRVENLRWVTQKENLHNPISATRRIEVVRRVCQTEEFRSKMSNIVSTQMKNEYIRHKIKESLTEKYKNPKMREKSVLRNTQKKCVLKISEDGKVTEYLSSGQAAIANGISQASVSLYCRGKMKPKDKTIWRYKDEINNG